MLFFDVPLSFIKLSSQLFLTLPYQCTSQFYSSFLKFSMKMQIHIRRFLTVPFKGCLALASVGQLVEPLPMH